MWTKLTPKPAAMAHDSNHFKQILERTPFHPRAQAKCRIDDTIAWNGFYCINQYNSTEQEYFAIRNQSSVFDLHPMMKYEISGVDAEKFLNRVVTRDVRKQKKNRVSYVLWCDEDGKVIDDGTLFRFEATRFRLCSQERQMEWLLDCAIGFDVTVTDVSRTVTGLTLQGPTSCSLLKHCGFKGIETLKPFEIGEWKIGKVAITVSRTGFTADLGYELWVAAENAIALWDLLFEHGEGRGLHPIGNAALNMARIEAGLLLPGIDFISSLAALRLNRSRSPYELGLGFAVDLDKPHFNGRRALLIENQFKTSRSLLVGLEIEGTKPISDTLLYSDESCLVEVGSVTSALWSPTCKRNIAIAAINAPYFHSQKSYWAELYLNQELIWQRRTLRCWQVERPFFVHPRRRQTPPSDF